MYCIFEESLIIFNLVVELLLYILEQFDFRVDPCNCNSDLRTITEVLDCVLLHLVNSAILLKEREIDLALTNLLFIVFLRHINYR